MKKQTHLLCPHCGTHQLAYVKGSRIQKLSGFVQRRRICSACAGGWSTIEVPIEMKTRLMDVEKLFRKSRTQPHHPRPKR